MHFVVPPMVRLFLAEKALAAAAFRLIERITAWRFNGRTRPALTPQGVHTDSSEAIFGAACFAPFHQTEALWKSRNALTLLVNAFAILAIIIAAFVLLSSTIFQKPGGFSKKNLCIADFCMLFSARLRRKTPLIPPRWGA